MIIAATIYPGIRRGVIQPYTITFDSQIFFISHNEETGFVTYNCFIDDDKIKKILQKILHEYLTNGKNVLYLNYDNEKLKKSK